ncbi:hypothetical protein JCGZ_24521 [Jatropha curcas]|uniref:Disease resistance RPP13-like protein 1 n=1 Tax=Jatropha curcas TaxID=180498 RepID=A0A067KWI6_JATCU|nr:putative disease resistance RPP13-like protein 1 [Jatropha curcas]XP_020533897.1 putative disease resistance RPP13-like protein 1 [Jatropha curcas]KDP40522.1 hypothetical protein JCGZ_24521 [Jatropha curcas]
MDAALVGGSFLSAFLQVLFDRMASRRVIEFFKCQILDRGLLEKLTITMNSVEGVLDDAEEKQITRPAVKRWFDNLKDAVYEADDLLDEIAYEALQRSEMEAAAFETSTGQLRKSFSSLNLFEKGKHLQADLGDIPERLEKILERLEFLVKQKDALALKEGIEGKPSSQKIPSTSLVDESVVYGRDDDKEAIMKLLLSDDRYSNNLGVIPFVGMGGIGKTTLAQLVYNDNRVCEFFDLKAWVCVSEEFDILKVTKDMLEEFNRKKCDIINFNQLQLDIKEILMGKRFLLVLDDVWTDEYSDWDILHTPLKFGAKGSKVIVTTRNENVASVMCTFPSYHHLNELTDDSSWLLFAKHAFDNGISGAQLELEKIGEEIVRKCKGLPLALKALGRLLRGKRNIDEWEKISKSNIWDLANDKILPALRLSYHYLPSHLKRCFAYCAIFPKDYEFEKDEIVLLWMAEGFLEAEDVGDEYFQDLVSRSFFQRSNGDQSCFIMHDLINDLAKLVSGEFCFWLDGDNSCNISRKTRHLSYMRTLHDPFKKFEHVCKAQHLRTFLHLDAVQWWGSHIDTEVIKDLLPKLIRLRVLSLSHYNRITLLPDSIGKLKHLRYLDLSKTSIRRLPETICSLYNLQTLILAYCVFLDDLPTNFTTLINLCHLDISWTILGKMPSEMGKLRKLQKLSDFFLGKDNGSSIKELRQLEHLQGKLRIWNLQNSVDAMDALGANIKGKKHLKKLDLRWDGSADDSQRERCVLESLQPHTNLESLSIFGYEGTRFPVWVGDPSFSNLVSLKLDGCKYCSSIPPLGQLVSLQKLSVADFHGILIIGPEFYGSCMSIKKPFGSLRTLKFERMPAWLEWTPHVAEDEGGAFPLLQELYIRECPNLMKALPDHLPSLTTLEIKECHKLEPSFPRAPTIRRMSFEDHSRRMALSDLPSGLYRLQADAVYSSIDSLVEGAMQAYENFITLEEIEIKEYYSLRCFSLELFPKLKRLDLGRCRNLKSFSLPTGFSMLSLTELYLWNCFNLKRLPDHLHRILPSLVKLRIGECPKLESFPEGGLPSKLESLEISCCEKLIASRLQWKLQTLPSLTYLSIDRCNDLESFPEEMLLPSTLTCLKMKNLEKLKSLDHQGLQHLTSLREMTIWKCPQLQSMPKEGFPDSLSSLIIWDCPLLSQRCQQDGGEYWPKISHIPHLEIDCDAKTPTQF